MDTEKKVDELEGKVEAIKQSWRERPDTRPTFAEVLLAIAESTDRAATAARRADTVIEAVPSPAIARLGWPTMMARADLALAFRARGPLFVFRAVAEDWSHDRLVREMY